MTSLLLLVRKGTAACLLALLLAFGGLRLPAQTTLATIRGLVTDASGAALPEVKVVVRNLGTNIARETSSGFTGNFEVTQLIPGQYEVGAEKLGFKKTLVSNILLETAAVVRVDLRMEVGDLLTSIEVQAAAPLINSESADVAIISSNQVMQHMPINVRGQWDGFYGNVATLLPGVSSNWSFAGSRGGESGITVDGASIRSPLFGNSVGPAQSNMEITAELRVQLANDKAEAGLPGGIYASSKSGTNAYHGGLFWYHSNSRLISRNTFSTSVPFQVQNNYGASVGGPVVRNRTFFFATYERFPLRDETIFNSNVPTLALRKGDFSSLLPGTVIRDPLTGTPFTGNVIPPERLSQTALKIQEQFYPLPNFGPADSYQRNYRGVGPGSRFKSQAEGRVDHQLTVANSLFVRLSWTRAGSHAYGSLVTLGKNDQDRRSTMVAVNDNHVFSPTLINEFRFGIMRTENPFSRLTNGPELIQKFGLQGISWNPKLDKGAPSFSFSNFAGISPGFQDPSERIHQVVNNLTWTRDNHTIKAGMEIRWNRGTNFPGGTSFPLLQFGQFSFAGAFSRFDYADFLLGLPQTAGRANAAPLIHSINTDMSLFVQDDWKVTPKLTLNLGVRYEYNPPYHEKDDNYFNFDPASGRLIVPSEAALARVNPLFPSNLVPIVTAQQAGAPKALWNTDLNNFVPRFGFAYRPFTDGRTVVRGGYGIYIDDYTSSLWRLGTGGPFISQETFTNAITGGAPLFQFPRAFPAGFGAIGAQSFSAINPDLRSPYIQQWNFTVERQLLGMGIRTSYIGTSFRKLPWAQNINQPPPGPVAFTSNMRRFPALRDILVRDSGGSGHYHSLHVVGERKTKSGLSYQLGWAWAKNLTDDHGDSEGGYTPQNSYARRLDRGDVTYTSRHRVTGNMMYDLPFGPGKPFLSSTRRLSQLLVGGWVVSSILAAQTGQFFNPDFSGFDVSNTNTTGSQRPDRISDGNLPASQRSIAKWFDKTAFVVPGDISGDGRPDLAVGRFGNAGVNTLVGPAVFVLHGGLYKQFSLTERFRATLEGTFSNILNHPSYALPNTDIRSSSAATIRSISSAYSGGPRNGRLGLRLEF